MAAVTAVASRSTAAWEADVVALLSAGQLAEAMHKPGPKDGLVRCYVRRIKSILAGPRYEMFLEGTDRLLMAARTRKKSKSSSIIISTDPSETKRSSSACLAKLKGNYIGTEYSLWDRGGSADIKKGFGIQALGISFKPTVNTIKGGPRMMSVAVPLPGTEPFQPLVTDVELHACLEQAKNQELSPAVAERLVLLHTQKPFYDEARKVHYLHFKGRVTKISLKNFQLVNWAPASNSLGSDIMLLFGKKGHGEFALDFGYPLNALQAIALAISSIDTKLCYTI